MAQRAYGGVAVSNIRDSFARQAILDIDTYLMDLTASLAAPTAATSPGLPGEPYITISNTVGLTNERALAVTPPVTLIDAGANLSATIAVALATPTITFASAPSVGSAASLIRSDAVLEFPQALQSVANSATVTLTDDGTRTRLTDSLDLLEIGAPTAAIDTAGTAHIGIGVSPGPSIRLAVSGTSTSSEPVMNVLSFTATPALDSSSKVSGISGTLVLSGGTSNQTSSGVRASILALHTSTITRDQNAVLAFINNSALTGGIQDAHIFHVGAPEGDIGARTWTNLYGLRIEDQDLSTGTVTNLFGIHSENRAIIENPASRTGAGENVLTLNQLDTTTANTAHMLLNNKTVNPATPVEGMLWRNDDNWYIQHSTGTREPFRYSLMGA